MPDSKPLAINSVAITETLNATYYESDGLVEIANTNSDVLFYFHAKGEADARNAIRQYLGIFGDALAESMEIE